MRPPGTPYTQEEIRSLHLKGAVYIRMSTEMQTESPENQERQIRAYAAQYGIEIVKVYADLGVSGLTAENIPPTAAPVHRNADVILFQ